MYMYRSKFGKSEKWLILIEDCFNYIGSRKFKSIKLTKSTCLIDPKSVAVNRFHQM